MRLHANKNVKSLLKQKQKNNLINYELLSSILFNYFNSERN